MGDPVFAGTINQTGGLEIRVTKLAKDSTIEKLVRMVEEAQTEKADTQRFLDRAEQFYAAGVILFTIGLIVVPILLEGTFSGRVLSRHDGDGGRVAVRADYQHARVHPVRDRWRGAARSCSKAASISNARPRKVVAFDKTGTLTEVSRESLM